jgi:hypothetical protein
MRITLAFVVQPLVAAVVGFAAFPIVDSWTPGVTTSPGQAALAFGFATGLVAIFVVPLAALPLFVWLRRRGPITLATTLISGAVLGNVLFVAGLMGGLPPHAPIGVPLFGTAVGMTCAAAFWWIAGRHLEASAGSEDPASSRYW